VGAKFWSAAMTTYDPTSRTYDPNAAYDPSIRAYDSRPNYDPTQSKQYPKTLARSLKIPLALPEALGRYATAINVYRDTERRLAKMQADYLAVLAREAALNRLKNEGDTPEDAWCVDYSDSLAIGAEIATLEPPGEINPVTGGGANIAPGGPAWTAAYGKLQYGAVMTAAGFAHAMTLLTPWMKWMPRWRYGVITAMDQDTASVTLEPVLSQTRAWLARDHTINDPWAPLTNIPIVYGICNGLAFNVGDDVVVEFTEVTSGELTTYDPKIIGFKSNPRRCNAILMQPRDRFIAYGNHTGWSFVARNGKSGGLADWRGEKIILSWPASFFEQAGNYRYNLLGSGQSIYRAGAIWATLPAEAGAQVVDGAAVDIGRNTLRCVTWLSADLKYRLWERPYRASYVNHTIYTDENPDGWQLISVSEAVIRRMSHSFYFSQNGTEAAALLCALDLTFERDQFQINEWYFAEMALNSHGVFSYNNNTTIILNEDLGTAKHYPITTPFPFAVDFQENTKVYATFDLATNPVNYGLPGSDNNIYISAVTIAGIDVNIDLPLPPLYGGTPGPLSQYIILGLDLRYPYIVLHGGDSHHLREYFKGQWRIIETEQPEPSDSLQVIYQEDDPLRDWGYTDRTFFAESLSLMLGAFETTSFGFVSGSQLGRMRAFRSRCLSSTIIDQTGSFAAISAFISDAYTIPFYYNYGRRYNVLNPHAADIDGVVGASKTADWGDQPLRVI
jgi:hypothetical protein